jgi:hypothetical protein
MPDVSGGLRHADRVIRVVSRGHRAGYLLRYLADLGQPGQGGPRRNLGDVVRRHDQFFDSVLYLHRILCHHAR